MAESRLERFAHNLDWNLLRTFVVVVEGFESFGEALRRKLLNEIAGLAPAPGPRAG